MADGHAVLDAQIARLRAMPGLVRAAAPKVAAALERELHGSISRGESPEGKAWPRTLEGAVALRNAGRSVDVRPVGGTILARLTGVHARHHLGHVRGGVRRQILPVGRIPESWSRAILETLGREFRRTAGGQS